MDAPTSNRGIWHIITGRSSLQEPDQIAEVLHQNKQRILDGVLWYKKPSASSAEKLMKSGNIKPKRKELVKKLSKILDVDEWQSLEIFGNYITNEFRGSMQQLQMISKDEIQTENLMTKILEYYFEERRHILQCLKYMLGYWQNPLHVFRMEFAELIEDLQDKDVLIDKIIEQYRLSCSTQIEVSKTQCSPLEKNRNSKLALEYLREQILLLEIMFLYYKDYLHLPSSLLQIAKLFQSQGFGTKQANRHLLDARSEALIPQISYLQVLILIESLYLEGVRNLMDDGDFKKHHLIQDQGSIKALDRLFVSWGSLPQHGPVMLAWAVLRYITMETNQEQDIRKVGSRALRCNVLEFLDGLLNSEAFATITPVSNCCKTVIYGLLFLVLTMFQEETLGNTPLLMSVLSRTLTEIGLCFDFWDTGMETGAGLLLKSASNNFPLQFMPFLELMKSLAGERESAVRVFEFLSNMPSYTELLRENSVGDVDCTGDDQVWRVVNPKTLFQGVQSSHQPLTIPAGTLGVVIPTAQGSPFVRWNYQYSCWDLFVFEIDAFLQSVSHGAGFDGQRVIAAVNLTNEILKNDWSKADHLKPITSRLYTIIQRCALSPHLPQDLLASCLTCLATLASQQPLEVWFTLQQTGFLPYCTTAQSLDNNRLTIESINIATGHLGVILNNCEQPTGYFPITMATLRLFLQLLCGVGRADQQTSHPVNFLDLASCLVFVLREVFTGFYKWRFTAMKDREEIGQRCLEIFNGVLGLQLKRPDLTEDDDMLLDVGEARQQMRSASVLQDVLSYSLLHTAAGQSLLHILGTGVDTVDRLNSLGGSNGSYEMSVVKLIKLAFSVVNKLLARKHKDEEISPLEQALSTQVIHQFKDSSNVYSGSQSQSHLVTVIASYIHHRTDCRLPTLATLLLKKLCTVAPMSIYASLGSEAVGLRDVFVSRLQSVTEDTKLKIAILEFIATAVETQPGLIELFLNLKEKDKDSQEFTLGQHSCLYAVLDMVQPNRQTQLPPALVSSAFMLFHALWFDRRDAALTAIRKSEGFWKFLMEPLFGDVEMDVDDEEELNSQLQTCSYAFQILALESYYVASGQLDDTLKTALKSFASEQRYQYWSAFMKSACGVDTQSSGDPRPSSPLFFTSNENKYLRLLRSWRSFLVVASTIESEAYGLLDAKIRNEILNETLEALKTKVSNRVSLDVLAAAHKLSSLYLMLLKQWKSSLKMSDSTFQCLVEILEKASNNDSQLLNHIRIPVFSAISILLQHSRTESQSCKFDSGYAMALLPLACEPLEYLNGRLGNQDAQQDKVLELSVFVIDEILNILLSNPGQWLPVLREHALFASLVQALDICLRTKEKLEFTEAVLHLFLSLSRIPVSAEALAVNNLSQTLCLGVAALFNGETDHPMFSSQPKPTPIQVNDSSPPSPPSKDWNSIWHLSLAVMASMLRTLRHGFLKEVLDFAGVHRERLARSMDMVRSSQSSSTLKEAEAVTVFLFELGHYSREWRFNLLDVLEMLQGRAGVLCQSCIALLTHPRLLAHLLEMSTGNPLQKGSQPLTDLTRSLSSSFTARELLRTYSYADEDSFRNNPVVSNTQSNLLKILCNSLAMLRQFTPDICEILLDEGMDIDEYVPVATLSFSSPAIDREEPLSFGTLLACLNMCLSNLSPGSEVRSPVKSPVKTLSETLPRNLLLFAMENAMVLILSQSSRYLRDPTVDLRVKQLLKRELGSELGHFLGGLNRHYARRGLPPSPLSDRTSPSPSSKKTPTKALAFTEAPEQRFFKLADFYVKKLLR